MLAKPLLRLVQAEKRIKQIEPRDFRVDRWMEGEGPRFWSVERVAKLKADNEALRATTLGASLDSTAKWKP